MSARLWTKMVIGGLAMCVGGPALVYYVSPSEEELFLKYNPELQKRSLANRRQNQEEFEAFVGKLKEYSKSDRPIWEVAKADEAATRARAAAAVPAALQAPKPPQAPAPLPPSSRSTRKQQEEEVRKALKEEALRSR